MSREVGHLLGRMESGVNWWIGDWLNYGEKYEEAEALEKWEYGTLAHMKWVSGMFQICRRRQNLSWSHHYEVASFEGLTEEEQDALLNRPGRWGSGKLSRPAGGLH